MPERKPDYYYTEIPEQGHTVTFITDQDSISFDVTYNKEIDFIMLLNGKDSCLTRVSARYKNMTSLNRVKADIGPDTLLFRLGDNSKIYLRGSLNGSQPLDIQFDLGAGGSLIKKSSTGKVNMNFDQTVTLHNTDGSNQVPSASKNTFQMGNLAWDSISVTVADNMTHREDMIIGNSLFRGKILEIDYDQMKMIIHDSLPQHAADYNRLDLALDGGIIPYIPVGLSRPGHSHKGWAMFDTGAYTTILNSRDVPLSHRLWGELLQMLGLDYKKDSPQLTIGKYNFSGFNYNAPDMGQNGLHVILGNDMLKRFNMILDNKNGNLYLKTNSLMNEPYGKRGEYYLVMIVVALIIFIAMIVIFIRVWRKRKNRG